MESAVGSLGASCDALSHIPDATARAAIEVDLFGRAGQKFDTIFAQGATDELSAAAARGREA